MSMTKNSLLHLLKLPDIQNHWNNPAFSSLQILDEAPLEEDTLYITTQNSFPNAPNVLHLESNRMLNDAFRFHQQYLFWREQCLRYAHVEHDMNTLLEICSAFLGWDLWIITPDYRMDAGSVGLFPRHLDLYARMSDSEVETLYHENPSFDETYQLRGVQFYPQVQVDHAKLYYCNLFQESLYLGRLLIMTPENTDDPGASDLMTLLCEDVEVCYRFLYLRRRQEDQGYRLYDFWKSLLENQVLDESVAKQALANKGWQASDTYQILYLVPAGYFYSNQTLKYYAVQLESVFSECIAAELNDGVYCLHNLSADQNANFRQKLSEFLRENLFRVGISNTFREFFDSRRYRLQAEEAMKLGQQKDPSIWRYDFCDYVTDYTLSQCLSLYSPRDLCPRNLQILLDYELEHPGGELLETLYQYYACQFNAQLAAQKLFIHRTTFFYRMNKIQKIAAFRPEDPVETCQIMLAFQALRKNTPQ